MTEPNPALRERIVNTIRFLAVDAVEQAKCGHPGAPMGLAAAAFELWQRHLRFDPRDPQWPLRDRFVLSNGHASMLLYSLLHLFGYDLSLDDLKQFRQLDSRTPGHPEARPHRRRRDHHRPAGPGLRERRRDGARRPPRAFALRARRRGPGTASRVRDRQRRRSDGRRLRRGRFARRPPRPRQSRLPLRRQPHHDRRQASISPSARTSRSASAPRSGTCSASPTATTTRRSRARSTRRRRRPGARR